MENIFELFYWGRTIQLLKANIFVVLWNDIQVVECTENVCTYFTSVWPTLCLWISLERE